MINRTTEIIYQQMKQTTSFQTASAAKKILNSIQSCEVSNQVLGLAAVLICMMHQYNLDHSEVMQIADNIVYSGNDSNMLPDFKVLQKYMKDEWRIN